MIGSVQATGVYGERSTPSTRRQLRNAATGSIRSGALSDRALTPAAAETAAGAARPAGGARASAPRTPRSPRRGRPPKRLSPGPDRDGPNSRIGAPSSLYLLHATLSSHRQTGVVISGPREYEIRTVLRYGE